MRRRRFHSAALEELEAAVAWYDGERPGGGSALVDAVEAAVAGIAETPNAYPLVSDVPPALGVRRCVLRRFPYVVVYVDRGTELFLIAVAHTRRRPGYWTDRVGPR